MSRSVGDLHEFCATTAAAARIFRYVHTAPELCGLDLDFGYGIVQGPRRAVARFSGRSPQRAARVLVWVVAETGGDGPWNIRHSLQWGE